VFVVVLEQLELPVIRELQVAALAPTPAATVKALSVSTTHGRLWDFQQGGQ